MKTSIVYTQIRRFAPAIVALAAVVVLGACSVAGPDETPWQNVEAFSWPKTKDTLHYRVDEESLGQIIKQSYKSVTILQSNESVHGIQMYRLNDTDRVFSQRVLFAPAPDVLFVGKGDVGREEFGGTYHLRAPLERGHTWISGYKYDPDSIPKWKATIVEQLSHLTLEGTRYKNVVVVKYELVDTTAPDYGSNWIRYYAEGHGPIQTIKNVVMRRDASGNPSEFQMRTRTVLINPTAASN